MGKNYSSFGTTCNSVVTSHYQNTGSLSYSAAKTSNYTLCNICGDYLSLVSSDPQQGDWYVCSCGANCLQLPLNPPCGCDHQPCKHTNWNFHRSNAEKTNLKKRKYSKRFIKIIEDILAKDKEKRENGKSK